MGCEITNNMFQKPAYGPSQRAIKLHVYAPKAPLLHTVWRGGLMGGSVTNLSIVQIPFTSPIGWLTIT
jgi:hypothetical protein